MSRLPLTFAGKTVTFRIPYAVPGDIDVGPNQSGVVFPDSTFLVNTDKPFEIHRVKIHLVGKGTPATFTTPTILEPQPTTLEDRIKLRITDVSKNQEMTKASTSVRNLIDVNTGAWQLEEPYTLVRAEGLSIAIDSVDYPFVVILDANIEPERVAVELTSVRVALIGYLLIIGPPSEVR